MRREGILMSKHKIVYPEAVYHLTHRAPGKEPLFLEESDYLRMLSLIKEVSQKFKWKIFCFCLMPNHLHLLIRIKESNLSKGAKNIFERYAQYFNNKYERKGPVFCKPFRVSLCLGERYLLIVSLYIHLNPIKSHLVSNFLDYRWSSLSLYLQKRKVSSFVDYKFILNLLSENIEEAKEKYKKLLYEAQKGEYLSIFQDRNALDKFRLSLLRTKRFFNLFKGRKKDGIWEQINQFRKKKVKRPESIQAKIYLIQQLLSNGYKVSEISSLLGVSRQAIYKLLTHS
jgi:putative transposase